MPDRERVNASRSALLPGIRSRRVSLGRRLTPVCQVRRYRTPRERCSGRRLAGRSLLAPLRCSSAVTSLGEPEAGDHVRAVALVVGPVHPGEVADAVMGRHPPQRHADGVFQERAPEGRVVLQAAIRLLAQRPVGIRGAGPVRPGQASHMRRVRADVDHVRPDPRVMPPFVVVVDDRPRARRRAHGTDHTGHAREHRHEPGHSRSPLKEPHSSPLALTLARDLPAGNRCEPQMSRAT